MIKSFRGIIADGGQARITLHTNDGKTGYKIVKLQIMTAEPYGGGSAEHLVQVWKVEQTTVTADVDFSDQTLLASAIVNNATTGYQDASIPVIVFDNVIFNQDIFVTHNDNNSTQPCNYHIELEQISLDLNGSTVATLQSLRSS